VVELNIDTSGSFKGRNSRWPADVKEVDGHLKLLAQAGVINADRALETFDEVRAMTWRLLNPRP